MEVTTASPGGLSFNVSHGHFQDFADAAWCFTWPVGCAPKDASMMLAKHGSCYLLRFSGGFDFLVDPERNRVSYYSSQDTSDNSIRHMLLDQVIPRMLSHQGHLVLHASAVKLHGQQGIGFLGSSGAGKSTLAASFHLAGYSSLADDALMVYCEGSRVIGISSYSGARLNPDSLMNLIPTQPKTMRVSDNSKKWRTLQGYQGKASFDLVALFILEPAEGPISIRKLEGREAIMSIINRCFSLDVGDMDVIATHFRTASAVARSISAVYSLRFPHDYKQLPSVREAVLSAIQLPSALSTSA